MFNSEDNLATITIVSKGDSEKMRHTDRTQNISFGWLKQQFEAEHFDMANVDTLEQVADIFTKPFAEKTKWLHALRLINHNLCTDVAQKGGKDSDSHLVAKPTIAAASHGRERIAQDLLTVKDFSYCEIYISVCVLFCVSDQCMEEPCATWRDYDFCRR